MVVTFTSDRGNFEEYFSIYDSQLNAEEANYKVGVGLFQWLRPSDVDDWSEGACTGYQQSVLEEVSDTMFETARGFGVFAVLLSFGVFIWCFFTACLSLNRFQIYIMRAIILLGTLCSGLTFLFTRSSLCTEAFLDRECQLDEGGLIMIAAVILWFVSFILSAVFFKRVDYQVGGTVTSEEDQDKARLAGQIAASRKARKDELQRQKELSSTPETQKSSASSSPGTRQSDSFDSYDSFARSQARQSRRSQENKIFVDDVSMNDELEVYVSRKLDNIEEILVEI